MVMRKIAQFFTLSALLVGGCTSVTFPHAPIGTATISAILIEIGKFLLSSASGILG